MKLEKHPFFRKVITPWYDSDPVCWTVAVLSFVVFAFSAVGVKVSIQVQGYLGYAWLPLLLAALSFFLFLKIVIRVTKRRKTH
jgi:hypothetical protein